MEEREEENDLILLYIQNEGKKYNDDHSREFKLCLTSKTPAVIWMAIGM